MAINNAVEIRREILTRLARLIVNDELEEKIDRLPLEMRPKKYRQIQHILGKQQV